MMVGHTKFAPDWCIGLLKQKFRRTKVGCLNDIVKVVEESAAVNFAQLVGNEDGTIIVPQFNWAVYFAPFFKKTAFTGIKSLHHLVFSSEMKGKAVVREWSDSDEKTISLLTKNSQWTPTRFEMPPEITPEGLSRERRQYLFEKIREFCPPRCQDIVCPDPSSNLPSPTSPSSAISSPPPSSPVSSPVSSPLMNTASSFMTPSPKRRCT